MIQPSVTIPVDPEAIRYLKPGEEHVISSSEPMTVYIAHGYGATVYPVGDTVVIGIPEPVDKPTPQDLRDIGRVNRRIRETSEGRFG